MRGCFRLVEGPAQGSNASLLFRGTLIANKPVMARKFRIAPRRFAPPQLLRKRYRLPILAGDLELRVIDCGQGNWNEVVSPCVRLIYDTGADRRWNAGGVAAFVRALELAGETREIHIVVSHWDVDHYHALLGATAADLSAVRSLVAPEPIPDTETCRRVLAWLRRHAVSVHLLKPANRCPGTNRRIALRRHETQGSVTLLRATRGSSRNKTGIALHVVGERRTAILTGDHSHRQVREAIKHESLTVTDGIYVVPHHGGPAGPLDIHEWRGVIDDAAISYGEDNPHGHPLRAVTRALQRIWVALHRTAKDGTRSWRL